MIWKLSFEVEEGQRKQAEIQAARYGVITHGRNVPELVYIIPTTLYHLV